MMPQEEINAASQRQANLEYGRYEGNQTSSARHHYRSSYEQGVREEQSGKVYPLPRDNANVLRFILVVLALGLILLLGLLFIFVIGGTTGWASLAVVCFAIMVITGFGLEKIG
ncbi:MAG TPA: hypothetical protein VKR83_08850 [Ktedonobacteraceae bacterium]|nr:hypothetical protein [Ktedonobacteraceae bacterium]